MQAELPDTESPDLVKAKILTESSGTNTIAVPVSAAVFRVIKGGVGKNEPSLDALDRIALMDEGVQEIIDDCHGNAIDLDWLRSSLSELRGRTVLSAVFFNLLSVYLEYLIKILDTKINGGSNVTVLQIADMRHAANKFIGAIPKGKETPVKLKLKILKNKIKLCSR